jgi:hypothetical protein
VLCCDWVCSLSEHECEHSKGYKCDYPPIGGPGNVVGIATGYGMDGPGIESQ